MIDYYKKCGYQYLSILGKTKKKKAAIVLYTLSEQVPSTAWEKQAAGSGLAALAWDSAWEVYWVTVLFASLPAL